MSRKGETPPDPRDALIGSLDTGETGCLVSRDAAGARFRVYVMLGEILAAQTDADDARLLARVVASSGVDPGTRTALRARVATGEPLVEALFDVMAEQDLMEFLFERFRENLLEYLASEAVEEFHPMDAVFTDNIQVGHDSRALVDELVGANTRCATLRAQPGMVLAPGAAPASAEREQEILDRCADRVRLADLLEASRFEPGRTLELVQGMLDRGTLVGLVPQPRRRGSRTTEHPEARQDAPGRGAAAEPAPNHVPAPEAAPASAPVSAPEATPGAPAARQEPTEPVVAHEPVAGEPPAASIPAGRDVDDHVPDDPTVEAPLRGLGASDSWMDVEDDLAAFQDYDTHRGGGSFLTDRALLDRVDLETREEEEVPLPASTETLIEMEDAEQAGKDALKTAVSLNFSGPKLHDDEIHRKLRVTNDVLATIAESIEAAEGRGSGQARLQLLVEGTSVPLAPLFKGVELTPDGRLPVAQVVKNLRKRPAGEHRRLLNRGLSDLIERALSAAFEVLDEPGLEAMLERIAGYQQRLGV